MRCTARCVELRDERQRVRASPASFSDYIHSPRQASRNAAHVETTLMDVVYSVFSFRRVCNLSYFLISGRKPYYSEDFVSF